MPRKKQKALGHTDTCAFTLIVGKSRGEQIDRPTGPTKVCISENQRKKLFNDAHAGVPIGCGTFACAYARNDGKVVKVTSDGDDANGMKAIQGSPYAAKVDEIYRLARPGIMEVGTRKRVVPVYAMAVQRVKQLTEREWKAYPSPREFAKLLQLEELNYDGPDEKFTISKDTRELADAMCAVKRNDGELCREISDWTMRAFQDFKRRGVVWSDVHPGNMGRDENGKLRAIDVGYTDMAPAAEHEKLAGLKGSKRSKNRRAP